ncbi:hypothetical protein PR048_016854 [Dryococelus australis]|uniref:Uncharacterized protein n=1 Tax=Dryococelus australis TaxID=614101 RepID=A0ABQ9H7W9_9NEOP|nr:hypothetical protein PR048_016854 [Dryococelus australis]
MATRTFHFSSKAMPILHLSDVGEIYEDRIVPQLTTNIDEFSGRGSGLGMKLKLQMDVHILQYRPFTIGASHPNLPKFIANQTACINVQYAEDRALPATRFPPRRIGFNPRPGHSRIFAYGNRAGRCRWPASFFFREFPRFPRPFIPVLLHTYLNHLTGSQDLAVESCPNIFALLHYWPNTCSNIAIVPDELGSLLKQCKTRTFLSLLALSLSFIIAFTFVPRLPLHRLIPRRLALVSGLEDYKWRTQPVAAARGTIMSCRYGSRESGFLRAATSHPPATTHAQPALLKQFRTQQPRPRSWRRADHYINFLCNFYDIDHPRLKGLGHSHLMQEAAAFNVATLETFLPQAGWPDVRKGKSVRLLLNIETTARSWEITPDARAVRNRPRPVVESLNIETTARSWEITPDARAVRNRPRPVVESINIETTARSWEITPDARAVRNRPRPVVESLDIETTARSWEITPDARAVRNRPRPVVESLNIETTARSWEITPDARAVRNRPRPVVESLDIETTARSWEITPDARAVRNRPRPVVESLDIETTARSWEITPDARAVRNRPRPVVESLDIETTARSWEITPDARAVRNRPRPVVESLNIETTARSLEITPDARGSEKSATSVIPALFSQLDIGHVEHSGGHVGSSKRVHDLDPSDSQTKSRKHKSYRKSSREALRKTPRPSWLMLRIELKTSKRIAKLVDIIEILRKSWNASQSSSPATSIRSRLPTNQSRMNFLKSLPFSSLPHSVISPPPHYATEPFSRVAGNDISIPVVGEANDACRAPKSSGLAGCKLADASCLNERPTGERTNRRWLEEETERKPERNRRRGLEGTNCAHLAPWYYEDEMKLLKLAKNSHGYVNTVQRPGSLDMIPLWFPTGLISVEVSQYRQKLEEFQAWHWRADSNLPIGRQQRHPLLVGEGIGRSPRKNPSTNGIVRHDSHMGKSGVTRPGIELGSPWWEADGLTARPPRPHILLNFFQWTSPCSTASLHLSTIMVKLQPQIPVAPTHGCQQYQPPRGNIADGGMQVVNENPCKDRIRVAALSPARSILFPGRPANNIAITRRVPRPLVSTRLPSSRILCRRRPSTPLTTLAAPYFTLLPRLNQMATADTSDLPAAAVFIVLLAVARKLLQMTRCVEGNDYQKILHNPSKSLTPPAG